VRNIDARGDFAQLLVISQQVIMLSSLIMIDHCRVYPAMLKKVIPGFFLQMAICRKAI
jgi:hypothetical protein